MDRRLLSVVVATALLAGASGAIVSRVLSASPAEASGSSTTPTRRALSSIKSSIKHETAQVTDVQAKINGDVLPRLRAMTDVQANINDEVLRRLRTIDERTNAMSPTLNTVAHQVNYELGAGNTFDRTTTYGLIVRIENCVIHHLCSGPVGR